MNTLEYGCNGDENAFQIKLGRDNVLHCVTLISRSQSNSSNSALPTVIYSKMDIPRTHEHTHTHTHTRHPTEDAIVCASPKRSSVYLVISWKITM